MSSLAIVLLIVLSCISQITKEDVIAGNYVNKFY